jgi:hypothetical protein
MKVWLRATERAVTTIADDQRFYQMRRRNRSSNHAAMALVTMRSPVQEGVGRDYC